MENSQQKKNANVYLGRVCADIFTGSFICGSIYIDFAEKL